MAMTTDNKTKVYSTYDVCHSTWNVMTFDFKCLFYGSIEGLEDWLSEHSHEVIECN